MIVLAAELKIYAKYSWKSKASNPRQPKSSAPYNYKESVAAIFKSQSGKAEETLKISHPPNTKPTLPLPPIPRSPSPSISSKECANVQIDERLNI